MGGLILRESWSLERLVAQRRKECYITLKDHKDSFFSKPETRLINPSNSDIGQISKRIVEKLNKFIRKTNDFNQWTSTEDVIRWYKRLEKNKYKLMKFDIKDFYPSITKKLRKSIGIC